MSSRNRTPSSGKRMSQNGVAVTHTFPILALDEILQCLRELGVDLSEADLKKPTPNSVRFVYETFVDLLMGLSREELCQPQFAALDALEYADLHEESIPTVMFYKALFSLMKTVGVRDFSLSDIFAPEYKRTRRNLSAVINFAKFREERIAKYTEETMKTEDLLDEKHQLAVNHQEYTQQLAQMKKEEQEQRGRAREIEKECISLQQEIAKLNKMQASRQSELRALKEKDNQVLEKSATIKVLLHNACSENARLKSQVVQSPEKVKRAMAEMREHLEVDKRELEELSRQSLELQARANSLASAADEIDQCYGLMKRAESEQQECKKLTDEAKLFETNIQQAEQNLREMESNLARIEHALQATKEKRERLTVAHAERKAEAMDRLDEVRRAKMRNDKERLASSTIANQNEIAAKQMRHKISQAEEAHEREMAAFRNKFHHLLDQAALYHSSLTQAMSQ